MTKIFESTKSVVDCAVDLQKIIFVNKIRTARECGICITLDLIGGNFRTDIWYTTVKDRDADYTLLISAWKGEADE